MPVKRLIAAVVTILLLAYALTTSVRSISDTANNGLQSSPLFTVERSFVTAERGDVEGFLDLFAGKPRIEYDRERIHQGHANFQATLKQSSAGLKGRVVEPVTVTTSTLDVDVRVERVYAHHHERQSFHLRRFGNGWKIVELGSIERFQPQIPYGTPVFQQP